LPDSGRGGLRYIKELKMNSDAAIKYSMSEVEQKIETIQKLLRNRVDDAGPRTPHQQRKITQSATQVVKLLEEIESLSPGFMDSFKGRLSGIVK
jgi:hypothetical protein